MMQDVVKGKKQETYPFRWELCDWKSKLISLYLGFLNFIRLFTLMSIATTKSTVAESELYTDRAWFIITVCSITKFAKNS
jgi:hypothetical protein